MRILVLLSYFNRPKLVRNALESVLKAGELHQDWRLVFGDDNSPISGEPILRDVMKDHLDKVEYINSGRTKKEKLAQGLNIGGYANRVLEKTDADIAIMLCDDDELTATYLDDLSFFYTAQPETMYAYSWVHLFNPLLKRPSHERSDLYDIQSNKYNYSEAIDPANKLDASQVSFRTKVFKDGVRFPETTLVEAGPLTANLDGGLFRQLYDRYGAAVCCHTVGQYKGIHDFQLVWHKKKNPDDLGKYIDQIERLGGDQF
jgi:glycosyltransferase involved in cell wall biosynthesis